MDIDSIALNFTPESLKVLNISLACIMFGIALELSLDNFKLVLKQPKAIFTGLFAQWVLLPVLTFLLILILQPTPSIALGMILIAACPGGNTSNFFSLLANGNTALSISLSAISTACALFFTPLSFAMWGNLYPETASLLKSFSLDSLEILKTIILILGLPLVLGMLTNHYFGKKLDVLRKPIRWISILFFGAFVIIAFSKNWTIFVKHIHIVVGLVFIHNSLALLMGYSWAKLVGLNKVDARSISIETGIQNTGLGLFIVFTIFDGLGGMALVMAWWGIWHLISGLGMALFWRNRG